MESYTNIQFKNNTNIEKKEMLTLVNKPIPDYNSKGVLDPRVFEVMSEQYKDKESTSLDTVSTPELVQILRNQMGWDNHDITTSPIKTQSMTIKGSNGDIPLRVYSTESPSPSAAVIYFHGGGFFGGSLKTVENPCKFLAEQAGVVVISVDYRLAPEHPFPKGLTDCFDTVKWVYNNAEQLKVDRNFIAVAGDSAGGNLATVCALMDRDKKMNMIKFQGLIYPVLILGSKKAEGYQWTMDQYEINEHYDLIIQGIEEMEQSDALLQTLYLQDQESILNPYISPLLANLEGMPPTLIVTAEFDYLRIQEEAYAKRLAQASVPTNIIRYSGMDHAFIDKIGFYPQAKDCMLELAKAIKANYKDSANN